MILGRRELHDPKNRDGYVCREELYYNGELVWCKIWTWVSGKIPLPTYAKFHEILERRLASGAQVSIANDPIIRKDGTWSELSMTFMRPLSKRNISEKLQIFEECLKETDILKNPMLCRLRRVK